MRLLPLVVITVGFILEGYAYGITEQPKETIAQLKADLLEQRRQHGSFESLTQKWEETYGASAFYPLIQIAQDQQNKDSDRYVAMMSAAKLGGEGSIPALLPLLKDSSWMIRGGALRALSAIGNSQTGVKILPLLEDPALVVRVEAVEAIRILRPSGAVDALIGALQDKNNYHAGRAQWVPQKALLALTALRAKEAIPKLRPILSNLNHRRDPEFKKQVQRTLAYLNE